MIMKSSINSGRVNVAAVNRSLAVHGESLDAFVEPSTVVYGEGYNNAFWNEGDDELGAVNRSLEAFDEEVDSLVAVAPVRHVKPRVNRGAVNRVLSLYGERV